MISRRYDDVVERQIDWVVGEHRQVLLQEVSSTVGYRLLMVVPRMEFWTVVIITSSSQVMLMMMWLNKRKVVLPQTHEVVPLFFACLFLGTTVILTLFRSGTSWERWNKGMPPLRPSSNLSLIPIFLSLPPSLPPTPFPKLQGFVMFFVTQHAKSNFVYGTRAANISLRQDAEKYFKSRNKITIQSRSAKKKNGIKFKHI